jgi:hypothetical protein
MPEQKAKVPPPAGSPPTERTSGIHRTPSVAAAGMPPPVVTASQAPNTNDVKSWDNSIWSFWASNGNIYYDAQFSVDNSGNFSIIVYSQEDYVGLGCGWSLVDQLTGVLYLGTTPKPYLAFPPTTGEEAYKDTCGLTPDYTKSVNFTYVWWISQYDAAGDQWWFSNPNYKWPFNSFIFQRGGLNSAAVEANVAKSLKSLPQAFIAQG